MTPTTIQPTELPPSRSEHRSAERADSLQALGITEEQSALQASLRSMMANIVSPAYLRECDEEHKYPYELYENLVKHGLFRLPFPEEYGGDGGGMLEFFIVAEELGRSGYDIATLYGTPIFNALNILKYGSDDQRADLIPRFLAGDIRFSISMTEPGAGSDAGAMRSSAVRAGDGYVINGEKVFSSAAGEKNNIISLYVRTGEAGKHRGAISCFLLPNDTPGLEIRKIETLGRRMLPTTQLIMDDVRVPVEALLGAEGQGWDIMLSSLELERVVTCAAYVGNAQTVVDEALRYAKEHEQFGRRIGDFQAIAHMLADMQTNVTAARLFSYAAAREVAHGGDTRQMVSMAKLFASEQFLSISLSGLQIMGGIGYTMEVPMQRHLRAALGSTITAGTSQIQRQTIAREMGLNPR